MFFVQKRPFYKLFFLANKGQEKVFYNILERKNDFLGHKNKKLKRQKIDIFAKGLTHGFGPESGHFPNFFFFWHYTQGKCL